MGVRSCFVPGCSTGYGSTKRKNKILGVKNKSLFKAKSESQLQKWRKAIPRKDKVMAMTDKVCELHFPPEDIERVYETRLTGGTVFTMGRGAPRLKGDAVPSIFPNLPSYLSKECRTRKPPAERKTSEVSENNSEGVITALEEDSVDDDVGTSADACEDRETRPPVAEAEDGNSFLHLLADAAASRCKEGTGYSVGALAEALGTLRLPNPSWTSAMVGVNVVFLRVGVNFLTEKTLVISEGLSYKIILKTQEVVVHEGRQLKSHDDVIDLIGAIETLRLCKGVHSDQRINVRCAGYVSAMPNMQKGRRSSRCFQCKQARKQMLDKERRKQASSRRRKSVMCALKKCRVKAARLLTKVSDLKKVMEDLRMQARVKPAEILEAELAGLSSSQQEAVRSCFEASKRGNSKGRRYTRDWVYECILLRIKSRKAYEHLRSHDILALPSAQTLSRYLEKVKGTYGFQEATFRCLKEKAQQLSSAERRGALLIDEMKLAPCVAFDPKTLKVNGFTNLGDYTPAHQKNARGDHALVMMYQPFRGRWVQALACFLSKSCASGSVLHHLILECVILLENVGFHVDLVVTDGAQWNRAMWGHFGIDAHNSSCCHPVSPSRKLWFSSDFPHLIKNVRNFFIKHEETWTPDGVVKLRHWEAIVKLDNPCGFQLKLCPFLTDDHIHPKPYQKMNVRRAFQFFSAKVAAAMSFYRERHSDLVDSSASIRIINRLQQLIQSLNSRTPLEALRKGSERWNAIEDFLSYLEEWQSKAIEKGNHFLSANTVLGLKVSLKTALEIQDFLEAECGFQYLMTARLNQDALERFFGMMRSACGANDHPDSVLFSQMFRLISTYSLVKPPRGSNISGGEMLSSLMSTDDISNPEDRSERLRFIMDGIIDRGSLEDDIPLVLEDDHNYTVLHTTDFVLGYFAGYVARKSQRFTRCKDCIKTVTADSSGGEEYCELIAAIDKGRLVYPSRRLFNLVSALEVKTVQVLSSHPLNVDSLFNVLEAIEDLDCLPLVGCPTHSWHFTHAILRFFVFTRMHFACQMANRANNASQEKTRLHRKMAKLN